MDESGVPPESGNSSGNSNDNDGSGSGGSSGSGSGSSSGGGSSQRRILTQISPLAWEHPADRAALNALRKLPGFDLALRKVFGMFGERAIRLAFKANAVKVSPAQYPWIHERLVRACEVLDVDKIPELYVSQTPIVNAGAVGMSDPFIVLNSSMLEILSPDEVEAVIGHELGHILSGHVLYKTLLLLVMRISLFRYPVAGLALMPLMFALLEWYRKSEVSCDRAGLLAVQDVDTSLSTLMKMAGGMRGDQVEELNLDEFVAQSEEYRDSRDVLDSVYKLLNVLGATHPFSVVRVAELRDWVDSGDYERILAGEYQRRGEEDTRPYSQDLAEAAKGYQSAANSFMDDLDSAVDKVKSRVTDAWKKSRTPH